MIGDPSGVWADYCAQAEADELRDELATKPAGPLPGSRVPPIADATGPQATEPPSPKALSPAPDFKGMNATVLDWLENPRVTGPLRTALRDVLSQIRWERNLNRYVEGPDA